MSTPTPEDHWQRELEELASAWRELGHERFWNLHRFRFRRLYTRLMLAEHGDSVFTPEQVETRREQLGSEQEQRHILKLAQTILPRRLWFRFRNKFDRHRLHAMFKRLGKDGDLARLEAINEQKLGAVEEMPVRELFSPQQRHSGLGSAVRSLKRAFVRRQSEFLSRYRKYAKLLGQLPEDELDLELWRLGEDYAFVGRAQEWYDEYDKMVDEILGQDLDDGRNEPIVRVLQSDFLLTMRSLLPMYLRYYEMRRHVFDLSDRELINAFSYFEQNRREGLGRGEPATAVISRFLRGVSHKLQLRTHESAAQLSFRERLLAVDHQARLAEWSQFKEQWLTSHAPVADAFNAFRTILVQAPEWRQELVVFRSALQVKKLMAEEEEDAEHTVEAAELEQFVARMARRVDSELSTDVLFRTLEQDLVMEGEYVDELQLVREQIKFEVRNRGEDAIDNIIALKQTFVDKVMAERAGPEADVRPLFSRPGSPGAWEGKHGASQRKDQD